MIEKGTAIYNFTGGKGIRTVVNEKELKRMKRYVEDNGWEVSNIYCDNTLKESEHEEFARFLREKDKYVRLVTKDFYHISGSTGTCMGIVSRLNKSGIQVNTIKDGCFEFTEPPLDKTLNIAIYFNSNTCDQKTPEVQEKIFKLFVQTKTKWIIKGIYQEVKWRRDNKCQEEFFKLIDNREKYDLLLIDSFSTINWKTINFCRYRKLLKMDIYSLYEGFLEYCERSGE